jgi:hypothetical protein
MIHAVTNGAESVVENLQVDTTEAEIRYSSGEPVQGIKSPLLCQLS